MDYRRFISYLYSYIDGEKGVNVGYIRCEQRQGVCRFTMNILDRQGIEGGRFKVYLYKTGENETPVGYYLDEMMLHRGCGELHKQSRSDNLWNTDCRIEDFDGVIAVYDKEHAYASQWSEMSIRPELFQTYQDWQKQKASETEKMPKYIKESDGLSLHVAEISRKAEESEESEESEGLEESEEETRVEPLTEAQDISPTEEQDNLAGQQKGISNAILKLMENRAKLPDFENHEVYDCVRIEPNDIGLLAMENWRLGVNSFLTHGYYNYKYLMLGKLRFQDGVVKAVLGVPGIFDSKEQYIAKIFGFEVFVPVKHTNVKTGNFGYWIVELV